MIHAFLTYIESERRYSPLTVRNYRHDLELFDAWRKGVVADRIAEAEAEGKRCDDKPEIQYTKSDDIREWILYRTNADKISPASMNRELSTLRSFFKYLRQTGAVKSDIFSRIGSLKSAKRLPSIVPESRIPQMLDATAEGSSANDFEQVRDALMVLMFYKCGIRLAELIGINTEDLSADLGQLKVRGKGDKERIVPLTDSVRTVLRNYFDAIKGQKICNSQEKALFLTIEGKRVSRTRVYRTIRSALAEIGMQGKKSPHVLRHTFATQLLNAGADMRDIQELMGHSSLSSTQVYTHNSIGTLQRVYAKAHPRD
ncbi:MAG: tyrosine-type recombinase/integrase [Alistipes sp.]|nr:tyrosine-type recombinase/integrase [Alistipes sp.]